MIVYLVIPTSASRPYDAFCRALGAENVGWVGRNVTRDELVAGVPDRSYRVLGGTMSMVKARRLPNVDLFTTIIPDPMVRTMAQWNAAVREPAHVHHADVHTFLPNEVFEENRPFASALSNAATNILAPAGRQKSADAVVARIKKGPFLVGFSDHAVAYQAALAKYLGVEGSSFGPGAFEARRAEIPRGPVQRALREANVEDISLIQQLRRLRKRGSNVVYRQGRSPSNGL
ncbi:MAG: hypothetical protein AAF615_03860 [Pseudomonadota bacterium]